MKVKEVDEETRGRGGESDEPRRRGWRQRWRSVIEQRRRDAGEGAAATAGMARARRGAGEDRKSRVRFSLSRGRRYALMADMSRTVKCPPGGYGWHIMIFMVYASWPCIFIHESGTENI